jgi:hypothetical protein
MGILSLFGRKSVPQVDLEDLIYEVAEHQRDKDFHTLYQRMNGREVFVAVVPSSLPQDVKPGQAITTDSSVSIQMRSVPAPNGQGMVPCATREDSSILKGGYVGMSWIGLLEMALKVDPPLYGALLQGQRSWVALDLARVRYVLRLAPRH